MAMKPTHILMLAGIVLISPAVSHAQVAGTTLLGVTVTELQVSVVRVFGTASGII
jgi:hypothetical protein